MINYLPTTYFRRRKYLLILFILYSSIWGGLSAQVSGTVYQDLPVNGSSLNVYGQKDANELGVEGVTVTVYPGGHTTTTDGAGDWSFTAAQVNGAARIEFSGWGSYLYPSADGQMENTSVQFVNAGDTNVDLGLHDPSNFVDDVTNLKLIAGVFAADPDPLLLGAPLVYTPTSTSTVVASWGYNDFVTSAGIGQVDPHNMDVTFGESGNLFSVAVRSATSEVFFSAVASPEWEAVPGGQNVIYTADYSGVNGSYVANSFGQFVDLSSLAGIDMSAQDPISAGVLNRFGEQGIGGIAFSGDGNNLYAVNMGNASLVSMAIGTPTNTPTAATEIPITGASCTNGNYRPCALTYHKGKLYIGGVCDAASGTSADLEFSIIEYDYELSTFTNIFQAPLDFTTGDFNTPGATYSPWSGTDVLVNPQPILTSIAIEENGSINVGLMGRGIFNDYAMASGSSLVRVHNQNGTLTLENGGVSGGVTTMARSAGAAPFVGAPFPGNIYPPVSAVASGPGDAWFYEQGLYHQFGGTHSNMFSSGLTVLQGSQELIAGFADPLSINTFGVRHFDTSTGRAEKGFNLGGVKAALVGDIELLTTPAPIEIGNLVWHDTDGDGVQDPGEAGLAGVIIKLFDATGTTELASATTDTNGNYIFSSAASINAATQPSGSHIYGLNLVPNQDYIVRIENALGGAQQANLIGVESPINIGEGANTSINDSNGTPSGTAVEAMVSAADIPLLGGNNHTFDFGFMACPPTRCGTVDVTKN